MLCHTELKENYFSILCLKMNEVSEFTCRKLNMTLAFLFFVCAIQSCVAILVTPEKTKTVQQPRDVIQKERKKERKHFLNKASSHLDLSA